MQNYKELKVWEKAHELVLAVYQVCFRFPKDEAFGLTSQFKRSAISIPANIAEGCGKSTSKDTVNFFHIALGSLHETEYYCLLSKDLNFVQLETYTSLQEKISEIKAMLVSLIKKIKLKLINS
jgi:four helix bundle protein